MSVRFPQAVAIPLVLLCLASYTFGKALGDTQHAVYFKNTDYELHVYRILGESPGKTLMILGGTHNEPGGYLAADLYVDMALKKGNLIVVPRANLPSVVKNHRWINGDMNRQFFPEMERTSNSTYEIKVVEVLKKLIADSDLLLNLHDGSGFYRPAWISDLKNPLRWGQSIIADDDSFVSAKDGHRIELRTRANSVIQRVNAQIERAEHHFHFNNTRTAYNDSPHAEMRSSATYFALADLGVEAYGIETSKEIEPLNLKVKYQSLAINAFLEEMGIIPQNPKIALDPPQLEYLLVSVNGGIPSGIPNGKTFAVKRGDRIRIEHIAANYERGLVADILGLGGLNDLQKDFIVERPFTVEVKKDQFPCGKVFIVPGETLTDSPETGVIEFLITVDGTSRTITNGGRLTLSPQSVLRIDDVRVEGGEANMVQLNFVGFVPPGQSSNKGEDRGYAITRTLLLARFSRDKKGFEYYITARHRDREIGRIAVCYEH